MISDKVRPHHLERKALLYVRQSSAHQVLHNRESSALQYAMRDRLIGRFVAYLQADLPIQAIDPLGVHPPALTAQQHMNAPIAIAHAGCRDLLDPFGQLRLPGSTGAVVVGRAFDRQRTASMSNAHSPG